MRRYLAIFAPVFLFLFASACSSDLSSADAEGTWFIDVRIQRLDDDTGEPADVPALDESYEVILTADGDTLTVEAEPLEESTNFIEDVLNAMVLTEASKEDGSLQLEFDDYSVDGFDVSMIDGEFIVFTPSARRDLDTLSGKFLIEETEIPGSAGPRAAGNKLEVNIRRGCYVRSCLN